MVSSARASAFLAAFAVVAVTGIVTAPSRAVASAPQVIPAPIGYIYAGAVLGGLDTLAVAPDHSVTVIRNTPAPDVHISGVALLHTKGGLWLYVESGPFGGLDNIYEYAVNTKTGAIARTKAPPVAALGDLRGNNLFAYDGYGANPAYTSVVYAQVCATKPCTQYGLTGFRANATTGALQKLASPSPAAIDSVSINGRW